MCQGGGKQRASLRKQVSINVGDRRNRAASLSGTEGRRIAGKLGELTRRQGEVRWRRDSFAQLSRAGGPRIWLLEPIAGGTRSRQMIAGTVDDADLPNIAQ
jgi:hypothetical protein